MNGIHDMGGMEGFGPVRPEPNEPPFHSKWEGRALAMNRALGYAKIWNIDKSRAKIEEMPPHEYLTKTYYQKWAQRLEQLLVEYGYIGEDEVKAGRSLRPGKPLPRFLPAAEVNKALSRGSYSREPTGPARFKAGDRVRTKNIHPHTHTRLPRYARDKVGVDRMRARLPRVPGFGRDRPGREPAMALHGAVRRARTVGRSRRSEVEGLDRSLGPLS